MAKTQGSVFLNPKTTKFGVVYESDKFAVGPVAMAITDDGELSVKTPKGTELVKPKTNAYGDYFIAAVGEQRYFISKRENDRGEYLLAKPAKEREDAGGRPQRPTTYGKRSQ